METVLLTGATGFLGSHLLGGLVEENYNVIIIKRTSSDIWRIKHLIHKTRPYDADESTLENIFKENKIDTVIHAATTYGREKEGSAAIIESNLLLPVKLLDLSISHGVESFINTDSFFNTANLNYKYLGNYSLSKKQLVEWLKLLCSKIQIVNLKLEHLYGPRDSNKKFITWLINEFFKNVPLLKLTKGEQKRDFIYVSDAVRAFLLVLKKRKMLSDYSEYEVGTGESIPVREFVIKTRNSVAALSGKEITTFIDFGAVPYIDGEIMDSKAENLSLKLLGWNHCVDLNKGLEKTIEELLKYN